MKSDSEIGAARIGVCDSHEIYSRGLVEILQERWRAVELKPGVSSFGLSLLVVGFSSGIPPSHSPMLARAQTPVLAVVGDCSRDYFADLLSTYSPLSILHRSAPKRVVLEAIESSLRQTSYVDRELDSWLEGAWSDRLSCLGITSREQEVLKCVAAGLSNKEIAGSLGISISTVKYHVAGLMAKTHANGRTELAGRFAYHGSCRPSGPVHAWVATGRHDVERTRQASRHAPS